MSHLKEALTAAADDNRRLLGLLSQTDYAPSSLRQNLAYITDLKNQIYSTNKELARLHNITEDERKDHVKYRDSTVKRFAYHLGGHRGKEKFASKQEKEEREFLEAWQREREAKEARDELTAHLTTAETDGARFEADAAQHDTAQRDLDALYASIFTGPTPEVPGEDEAETSLQRASAACDDARTQHGAETQASAALARAELSLGQANRDMDEALRASSYDVMGGGTFADMMERDALSRAQNGLSQGFRQLADARRAQPAIRDLSGVEIDHGHFVSDVLFDNIFSDMRQHDRIRNSAGQLQVAMQQLSRELGEQRQREYAAEARLQQATGALESARRELQRIRAEAFERYADGGAPPLYQP